MKFSGFQTEFIVFQKKTYPFGQKRMEARKQIILSIPICSTRSTLIAAQEGPPLLLLPPPWLSVSLSHGSAALRSPLPALLPAPALPPELLRANGQSAAVIPSTLPRSSSCPAAS